MVVTKNGSYTDPKGQRKSKRLKLTDPFPVQKDVSFESCKNNKYNVSDDCFDGEVCHDMDKEAESHRRKKFPKKKKTEKPDSKTVSPDVLERFDVNEEINDEEVSLVQKPRLSEDSVRRKVEEVLSMFRETCRKIIEEEEANPNKERNGTKSRVDFAAAKLLKSQGKSLNTGTQIMGHVPGVQVGDEFIYRMELNVLGIHKPNQAGIDYLKDDKGKLFATSVVASECHNEKVGNSDFFIYTGQGGNVIKGNTKHSEPKDQELVKGNRALANSKVMKNFVRVIKGSKRMGLASTEASYVYDGLYLVEDYWQETGSHGKLVFKFKLRRIPGQPKVSLKAAKKPNKPKKKLRDVGVRDVDISEGKEKKPNKSKKKLRDDGIRSVDISEGKETIPIRAVNEIDNEKPPSFIYTVKMVYPDWCKLPASKGCHCTKQCSESRKCCCVAKNGGESPYNDNGEIIIAKPLVYECGPLCKCPPSCYLRVTQRGIKFKLEIFKTEKRGWGVRSRNMIPSGSFICEYTGEILEENEAERLSGKDEYLFDIGKDHDTSGFTIDAAKKGNVGRFINHSCSPNLYAQDVLYDHDERKLSHVIFFAQEEIAPLEELTYDYNYVVDHVRDAEGNIKKKLCHCGSSKCTGRLY